MKWLKNLTKRIKKRIKTKFSHTRAKNTICEYVWHGDKRVGLLKATRTGNSVLITWSICNPRDKFSKAEAHRVADQRAKDGGWHFTPPNYVYRIPRYKFTWFKDRCQRYFKDALISFAH